MSADTVFLPWLRRGIATTITQLDTDAGAAGQATVSVGVNISELSPGPTATLELAGPESVTGIDPRAVIRVWPQANTFEAEPNYLPIIEFDQPDLPWRYTPASPDPSNASGNRLRPWICLIVLKDSEIAAQTPPSSLQPLATVTVAASAPLPDLSQSWAWAHAHVSGAATADATAVGTIIDDTPQQIVARLICPRHLEPKTSYTCFLVPAFGRGVLAALGQDFSSTTSLAPAWPTPTAASSGTGSTSTPRAPVTLPVYYSWRFGTGLTGDFEALVERLQARPMPDTVGRRSLDASNPGSLLPGASAAGSPMLFGSALEPLGLAPSPWDPSAESAFVPALAGLLNAPAEQLAGTATGSTSDTVLAPPLYGRWPASETTLDPSATGWFEKLNSDPRNRLAAALGTTVVQQQQQQLMASAWSQVEGIREANVALSQSQLGREASAGIYARDIVSAASSSDTLVGLTTRMHSRIAAAGATVSASIAASPIAPGTVSAAWRRLSRLRGPLGRKLAATSGVPRPGFLSNMNTGALTAAPAPRAPAGAITPARIAASVGGASVSGASGGTATIASGIASAARAVTASASSAPFELSTSAALTVSTISATILSSDIVDPAAFIGAVTGAAGAPVATGTLSGPSATSAASQIATATANLATRLAITPRVLPALTPVDFVTVGNTLLTGLAPETTITNWMQSRLDTSRLAWTPPDALDPVMAAPVFPQPMSAPLTAISNDWLLSGLGDVPADTIALLQTNDAFVESYLVGLNHEMARTLLWNEYPTDQRGTYFAQFWNPAGAYSTSAGTPTASALLDIAPIAAWPRTSELGDHPPDGSATFSTTSLSRTGASGALAAVANEQLALLIRGEVVRRYPTMLFYAVKAYGDIGPRSPGATLDSGHPTPDDEHQAIFTGTLPPDVLYVGFDIRVGDVVPPTGATTGSAGVREWFFVVEEQIGAPKFGLEDSADGTFADWSQLTWTQTGTAAGAYIDLSTTLPASPTRGATTSTTATGPGMVVWRISDDSTAADLATILLREPVRVIVRASTLVNAALGASP